MTSKLNHNFKKAYFLGTFAFALSFGMVVISPSASAAETAKTASKEKKEEAPAAGDDMRCEKLVGVKLSEFKDTLVENCNLNKPFSTSVSRLLNDETYFYCCHKR